MFFAFYLLLCCLIAYGSGNGTTQEDEDIAISLLEQQVEMLQQMVAELENEALLSNDSCPCNETITNLTMAIESLQLDLMPGFDPIRHAYLLKQVDGVYEDCRQIYDDGHTLTGVYQLWLVDHFSFLPIYCDMDVSEVKGWMTIQRRFNGELWFARPWKDYNDGFGWPSAEHWIGLKHFYALTRTAYTSRGGRARLRIDMTDKEGVYAYVQYERFEIADEKHGFRLIEASGFSGNASDVMGQLVSYNFTTSDRLMRGADQSCAHNIQSGWWRNECGEWESPHYLNGVWPSKYSWLNNKIQWRNWTDVNPNKPDLASVSIKVQRYFDEEK